MADSPEQPIDRQASDRVQQIEESVVFLQHEQDALGGEIASLHRHVADLKREIDRLKQALETRSATDDADDPP